MLKNFDTDPMLKISHPKEEILFRDREISAVRQLLINYPLVQVSAESGMGKSLLVHTLCFSLQERSIFKDGILFIDLFKQ